MYLSDVSQSICSSVCLQLVWQLAGKRLSDLSYSPSNKFSLAVILTPVYSSQQQSVTHLDCCSFSFGNSSVSVCLAAVKLHQSRPNVPRKPSFTRRRWKPDAILIQLIRINHICHTSDVHIKHKPEFKQGTLVLNFCQ